eukprot:scaffold11693_cov115-Isochrysis_galbana.AAC.16
MASSCGRSCASTASTSSIAGCWSGGAACAAAPPPAAEPSLRAAPMSEGISDASPPSAGSVSNAPASWSSTTNSSKRLASWAPGARAAPPAVATCAASVCHLPPHSRNAAASNTHASPARARPSMASVCIRSSSSASPSYPSSTSSHASSSAAAQAARRRSRTADTYTRHDASSTPTGATRPRE